MYITNENGKVVRFDQGADSDDEDAAGKKQAKILPKKDQRQSTLAQAGQNVLRPSKVQLQNEPKTDRDLPYTELYKVKHLDPAF